MLIGTEPDAFCISNFSTFIFSYIKYSPFLKQLLKSERAKNESFLIKSNFYELVFTFYLSPFQSVALEILFQLEYFDSFDIIIFD